MSGGRQTSRASDRAEPVALASVSELVPARAPVLEPRSLASASKRGFDLIGAAVITLLLSPVLALIAIAIKLDSRGPILYRSLRVGRGGQPLMMLKFRTMFDGAESQREALRHLSDAPDGLFKMQHDPRLTRFGRFLRSTSLDEVPQLFQVLKGDMSLVGPRPLPPNEDRMIAGAGKRLQARPGMTGPWQVAGSWRVPLTKMVALDDEYIANWSLWLDVKLLARTAGKVVRRAGV